jgi:PAS domain S-box-containing protein
MSQPATTSFRVLLIEDSPGDRFLLREMIELDCDQRFRVAQITDTLARGVELARREESDVVLLDLFLSDASGLDAFDRIHEAVPQMPVIVLSERDDEELALHAVQRGAADYLVKGRIDSHLLQRSMRYAIERTYAETDLARERDLFNTLLENVPDRIYFKDRESRFIRINRALTRLLRLQHPEEAYGKTDADFYDESHASAALADELRVMATGEPMIGKVEFETLSDGRRSWSLTTKLPLSDRRGRIVGTCGISREITEIKEMELALSAERNLLRGVIDNLPDAIFLKDCKGRYLLDNATHWSSLGVNGPEDVIGRTVFDFFPGELAEQFQADDLAIVKSGKPLLNREEKSLNRLRGSRWMLTTKVPWHDENGGVLGVLCLSRDITEQKEAAERLRQAYVQVEQSRQETQLALDKLRLAHSELRSVQLQLVEAEKMKSMGRLAAGVAHEVKNPLAIVRMGVEFLQSHLAGDETSTTVIREVAEAVNRADSVIRELLDFSAPKKLALAETDLNKLIEQSLQLTRGERVGEVKVIREFQRDLPLVPLDSGKMSQVFVNLVTNALHAMERGGELTVRTYAKQLTGVGSNIADVRSENFRVGETLVVAEIDDSGVGIPEDKITKIFEPFFTTKPTGKGTGLGLSVVKTIVDLHGATIDLRNLPGGGTRVTLMFRV